MAVPASVHLSEGLHVHHYGSNWGSFQRGYRHGQKLSGKDAENLHDPVGQGLQERRTGCHPEKGHVRRNPRARAPGYQSPHARPGNGHVIAAFDCRTAKQVSHRGYESAPRSTRGHDPTQKAPSAPPTGERSDWPDGRKHVLHDARATTLYHRSKYPHAQGVLPRGANPIGRRGHHAEQARLLQNGNQSDSTAEECAACVGRLPLHSERVPRKDLLHSVQGAREEQRRAAGGGLRVHAKLPTGMHCGQGDDSRRHPAAVDAAGRSPQPDAERRQTVVLPDAAVPVHVQREAVRFVASDREKTAREFHHCQQGIQLFGQLQDGRNGAKDCDDHRNIPPDSGCQRQVYRQPVQTDSANGEEPDDRTMLTVPRSVGQIPAQVPQGNDGTAAERYQCKGRAVESVHDLPAEAQERSVLPQCNPGEGTAADTAHTDQLGGQHCDFARKILRRSLRSAETGRTHRLHAD
uniref:(northern house mosquito) hypothetical protein n=2 Tax=Culex pipiens TaxID=7175 RepID=A0A8D8CUS8_CULPI